MQKHHYAVTSSSEAHNIALAFNNKAERALYMEAYGDGGKLLSYSEAMRFPEIRHFYGKLGNDWLSQLYPRTMW